MIKLTDLSQTAEEAQLLVVGAGPAGLTAGIYGARFGLQTVVLEKLAPGGQIALTDIVENYPGFPEGIRGGELAELMERQAKRFGVKVVQDGLSGIEPGPEGFNVTLDSGSTMLAKAVIIATGADPRKLEVPGEAELTGRGVSYCAVCDGMLYKGKRVAVIGGGDSALSEARYLASLAKEVYLVHRRRQYRAQQYLVDEVRKLPNVIEVNPYVVKEIKGKDKVEGVVLRHRETDEERFIELEGVFIYIGLLPNSAPFLHLVDTDEQGFIKTDELMRTKTPGLFAAGDVRSKALRQVATAVGDGALAAQSAYDYLVERKAV